MNTSPDSSWFYAEGKERKGPVPFSTLQSLLSQGLPATSLVWTEGMAEWAPATTVPGLVGGSNSQSDPSNPYAAPAHDATLPVASTGYTIPAQPIPLDIGFCIGQGWKHTLGNFGTIFLFGLCYLLVAFAVSFCLGMISVSVDGPQGMQVTESGQIIIENSKGPVSYLMDFINNIFTIFLGLGAIRWGHRFLDGENPPIGLLFSQGSKLVTGVLAGILYGIAVLLGLILLIVPGIILALRLSFYQQAIVEKDLGIIDSLKYSWELTRDNTLSLLGLVILTILIAIAGMIALLVGLIWAIPTIFLAYLIAFRFLHNGANGVRVIN